MRKLYSCSSCENFTVFLAENFTVFFAEKFGSPYMVHTYVIPYVDHTYAHKSQWLGYTSVPLMSDIEGNLKISQEIMT